MPQSHSEQRRPDRDDRLYPVAFLVGESEQPLTLPDAATPEDDLGIRGQSVAGLGRLRIHEPVLGQDDHRPTGP
jgi:hypothetical protein